VTLAVRFKRGWLPPGQAVAFMAHWDDLYREIRRQNRESGVLPSTPANTAELHKTNINLRLKTVHSSVHRVHIPSRPPAPALQEVS
jgi:hypothetical protein